MKLGGWEYEEEMGGVEWEIIKHIIRKIDKRFLNPKIS